MQFPKDTKTAGGMISIVKQQPFVKKENITILTKRNVKI